MSLVMKLFRGFDWEENAYRTFQVHHFKKILPLGDYWVYLIRLVKPDFRIIRNKQSAIIWTIFTVCVELIHGLAMIIVFAVTCIDLVNANFGSAAVKSVINIFFNIYPIMVQRYNRLRLIRAFRITLKDLNRLEIKI